MIVKTNFSRWVFDIGGTASLASKLHCSKQAVYYWLNAKREPHFHAIRNMVRLSEGRISVVDIHEHFEIAERSQTCNLKHSR